MLNKVQLFLQIARMVAVDDGERAHDDTSRRCALPFHQRIAHEIANDFAAVLRKTATRRQEMVEANKKVFPALLPRSAQDHCSYRSPLL